MLDCAHDVAATAAMPAAQSARRMRFIPIPP
jgi:hypothetical protein